MTTDLKLSDEEKQALYFALVNRSEQLEEIIECLDTSSDLLTRYEAEHLLVVGMAQRLA